MSFLNDWRTKRHAADEQKVLRALGMLRPSNASGWPICRLAQMGPGRTYPALARLEARGAVTSDWTDGPDPRRRIYRVVTSGVRS